MDDNNETELFANFKPDLSNEGLRIMNDNLRIITEEYCKATGISEDKAEVKDVSEYIKDNKEYLKTKLHPRTAMFLT